MIIGISLFSGISIIFLKLKLGWLLLGDIKLTKQVCDLCVKFGKYMRNLTAALLFILISSHYLGTSAYIIARSLCLAFTVWFAVCIAIPDHQYITVFELYLVLNVFATG